MCHRCRAKEDERGTCAHMLNNNILAWLISIAAIAMAAEWAIATAERRQLPQQRCWRKGDYLKPWKFFYRRKKHKWERVCWCRAPLSTVSTVDLTIWIYHTLYPYTIALRYHITTNMHARHQSATKQKRVGTKLSRKRHTEHTPRTTTMRKDDDEEEEKKSSVSGAEGKGI